MTAGTDVIPAEVQAFLPDDLDLRVQGVEAEAARAKALAESIQVDSEETAETATALLRKVIAERKKIEAEGKALRKPRNDAAKLIKRRFDALETPFLEVEEVLRKSVQEWTDEQERIRREEQERLDREREAREREEREKREAEEAAAREAQEEKELEAREARELAAEDPEMAELAEEATAEAQEAATAAEGIAALPEPTLPRSTVAAAAKPSGISSPKRWEIEVTDLAAVPAHLPDGEPLIEVRTGPLRSYLHSYVRDHGEPPEIAGIEFKRVTGQAVRT